MKRMMLVVVWLLAAAPAMASGLFGGPREAGQMPLGSFASRASPMARVS
jgi:hypothetical protein